ncbi:hypothetical protein [Silvimonas sp.]|uniref:hypothetical protein n=1 Tax=Silvimonas sp. TaxID=2650811 RepID=UPI002847D566|nr:hypothetical protein [Silvimonas sp.]MDR3428850.1 hypothetical protein [Silvimonas sp.]
MKKILVGTVCVLLIAGAANAATDLYRGMMLMDARTALFKAGWKGIVLHKHPSTETTGDDFIDAGAMVFYKAGIHEIDSCTGGVTQCQTHYRKGTECLTLNSIGETPHDAFVTHWMNTCGD